MESNNFRVPRKAWEKSTKNDHDQTYEAMLVEPQWLSEWRDEPAYVLLGDPGSGKTESLKAEAEAVGGKFLTASEVRLLYFERHIEQDGSEVQGVFIDALDESIGTSPDKDGIFGAIRWYLRSRQNPRFRIACREADWLDDSVKLQPAAPSGQVKELHLSPLSDRDIEDILNSRNNDVPDAKVFIEQVKTQGVQDWLRNPLLLNLMVESAAQNGQLPASRLGIYEAACYAMAKEHNDRHRGQVSLTSGVVQNVLEDAGDLCALLLLSGKNAISKSAKSVEQVLALPALPNDLKLHNTEQAVKSKLFSTEGDLIRPRHRTIAEFLGAQALAKRITEGLPLSRVLALVQGHDGVPVESMRGLYAWLAVQLDGKKRQQVLEADPLGFIVNGDAARLTHDERLRLIKSLANLSAKNPWYRYGQWENHPFGPLAKPDMQDTFAQELASSDRSEAHQRFIDCLLAALQHAQEPMPALAALLALWVTDAQVQEFVRVSAYKAWRKHAALGEQGGQINAWLDDLETQRDIFKSLVQTILHDAYPKWIEADVLRFLPSDHESLSVWWFWPTEFMRLTTPDLLPSLARAWLKKFPKGLPNGKNFERKEVASALLCAVVEKHGDSASNQDLYEWLAIGLGRYGLTDQNEKRERIVLWLQSRPEKIKAVAELCWANVEIVQAGDKSFSTALRRLHGVPLPSDWLKWQMSLALKTSDSDVVRHLLVQVTSAVESKLLEFDLPKAQELEDWNHELLVQHPDTYAWLEAVKLARLDESRVNKQVRIKNQNQDERYQQERSHRSQQRRKAIQPHLDEWPGLPFPSDLLREIAIVYKEHVDDVHGETPLVRVADYLGIDSTQDVNKVLQAVDDCLTREDLPTTYEILEMVDKNQDHDLRLPCLLAAQRACERDDQSWRKWSERTQQVLMTFCLIRHQNNLPNWFRLMGAELPGLVAPILLCVAKRKFKPQNFQTITGLFLLCEEPTWQTLTECVLPELLKRFPAKAGQDGIRVLNNDLLNALQRLPPKQAKTLVEKKLALKSFGESQRIAWLVAWLPYEPIRAVAALAKHLNSVESKHRCVVILHHTFTAQSVFAQSTVTLPLACVRRLIELIAPLTPCRDSNWKGGAVTDEMERERMVQILFMNLGNNPIPEATIALQTLASDPKLKHWLQDAQFHLQQQQRLHREAAFEPVSVQAVTKVLCNQAPANVADLLALVVDHLEGLEAELRGEPSFRLRHFWRGDTSTNKAKKAKRTKMPCVENDCTLELLELLGQRLRGSAVTLVNESEKANQKRADLEAICEIEDKRITLPIEAKREDHNDVWTAWRHQLAELYAIDPAANGHGVYLVYWFGLSPKIARPRDGSQQAVRPQSSKQMQTMLLESIPAEDRHRIKVVVLDLSWPDGSKATS